MHASPIHTRGSESPPVNGSDVLFAATVVGVVVDDEASVEPSRATVELVVLFSTVEPSVSTVVDVVDDVELDVAVLAIVVEPRTCSMVVDVLVLVLVGATLVDVLVDVLVEVLVDVLAVLLDVTGSVVVVACIVVVVFGYVVVVVPSPLQTCVTLNVDPSWPPVICAVALRIVSLNGTCTLANFGFDSTVPCTVPAVAKVAERLTNASPCESGNTKIHPGPCAQLFS